MTILLASPLSGILDDVLSSYYWF